METSSLVLVAMFGLGPTEMIIVGALAVLLFGSRLPSVARSMGKSLTEFKRGMQDVEREVKGAVYDDPAGTVGYDNSTSYEDSDNYDESEEPTSPKFEPPATPPRSETTA